MHCGARIQWFEPVLKVFEIITISAWNFHSFYLRIETFWNSENGRLRKDGNTVPSQTENSSKHTFYRKYRKFNAENSFRYILMKARFPVDKYKDKSGAWQQEVASSTSKFASFSEFAIENEHLSRVSPSLPNFLPFGAEGSGSLLNLPNLPFSEFGSQSNRNSESSKSTVSSLRADSTDFFPERFSSSRVCASATKSLFWATHDSLSWGTKSLNWIQLSDL